MGVGEEVSGFDSDRNGTVRAFQVSMVCVLEVMLLMVMFSVSAPLLCLGIVFASWEDSVERVLVNSFFGSC